MAFGVNLMRSQTLLVHTASGMGSILHQTCLSSLFELQTCMLAGTTCVYQHVFFVHIMSAHVCPVQRQGTLFSL